MIAGDLDIAAVGEQVGERFGGAVVVIIGAGGVGLMALDRKSVV